MSTAASLQNLAAQPKALSNSTHAGLLLQRKCACGSPTSSLTGECAECNSRKHLQTKLAIGASNDPLEQEADRVADQVLAGPAHSAVDRATPHIQRLAGQVIGQADTAPASVDHVLTSSGRPLEPALRQDMEQRFGHNFSRISVHSGGAAEPPVRGVDAHTYSAGRNIGRNAAFPAQGPAPTGAQEKVDFGRVRIHDDEMANRSAAALGARAYAYGEHIVFGRAQLTHRVLAHELVHVAQQGPVSGPPRRIAPSNSTLEREAALASNSPGVIPAPMQRAAPGMMFLDSDPAAKALYPSVDERSAIQDIVNPPDQSQTGASGDVATPTDPTTFRAKLTARIVPLIDARLPHAEKVRDASVVLGDTDLGAVATAAEMKVEAKYGRYLQAGGTDITSTNLRARLHFIATPEQTSAEHIEGLSQDFVTTLVQLKAEDILSKFGVAPGTDAFNAARDEIVAARTNSLRTIVLFIGGFETPSHNAFVQRRAPASFSNESDQQTRRRGRWDLFGTTLHEMLHSVAHENYSKVVEKVKRPDVFIEGAAELFTQEVYGEVANSAQEDDALRLLIEGASGSRFTPPERVSAYYPYVVELKSMAGILGGNDENLRVAFFMGRVEYLGLGGWNKTDALRRYEQRFPAWDLGTAIVGSLGGGASIARVRIGRVVYGRTGALQLNVGGGISYLSSGESRPGAGGDVEVRYQQPRLYLGAGVLVQGSYARGRGVLDSLSLDAITRVEAGTRVGRFRLGGDLEVYVPIAGDADGRTLHLLVGLGLSVVY